MLTLLTALVLSPITPPEEELARAFRAAIWYDLRSNAWIGNGNELAARWFNGGSDRAETPSLHIQDLVCDRGTTRRRCRFDLFREGGSVIYLGQVAPERLACRATFLLSSRDGRWAIPRLPPGPEGGHSRITIRCQPVG